MSINGDNNGVVTDVVGQDVSVVFSDELVDMLASSSARLGVNILNDDVMMSQLMKQVTERAMQAEMDEHLGYSKNEARGRGTGNSRNGTSSKTVTVSMVRCVWISQGIELARLPVLLSRRISGVWMVLMM